MCQDPSLLFYASTLRVHMKSRKCLRKREARRFALPERAAPSRALPSRRAAAASASRPVIGGDLARFLDNRFR
jgi:hypothetical protein